jgi:flagellar biosynthesis protein FlhG
MRTDATRDQAAALRRECLTLAITSGKGGVGKTSVAVNLALLLARAGSRTCLLDGDLGLANVDVLLNLHPRSSLREVLTGTASLEQVLMEGPGGLRILPAASGIEALADLSPEAQRGLVAQLPALGDLAEVLVLDTAAGLSPTVLALVQASDDVIVVTTPEPTALTDAYAMVKVLSRRQPALPVSLLVNEVAHAAEGREVHQHLNRIVRRFLGRELPLAGWIPRDECVERAVREQRPLVLFFPHARASVALGELARRMMATWKERAGLTGDFWRRLLRQTEAQDG